MKIQYFLACCCFLILSCNNNSETEQHEHKHKHHHTDSNKSNVHMNKSSFEDLVQRFEDSTRIEWQKPNEVIALLGDVKGKTIMDIGAGTGYFAFRLAEKGANIIAADVDERFIDFINKKEVQNVTTRLVPYDSPKLAEAEVDAVIIIDTYHHIEARIKYFKQVLKGLKKGGQLMIVDFKKEETPHGPPVAHKISADDVVKELKESGFTTFDINKDLLPYQYVILAK